MTTYYVNSAATGDNDGSTPTNAWTSLASATGVVAGSEVLIDDGHSEDPGGSVTYNFSNGTVPAPIKIVSADLGTAGYPISAGATIAQGTAVRNITIQGHIYVYGVTFNPSGHLLLGSTAQVQRYESCTLGIVVTTDAYGITIGGGSGKVSCESCTFNASNGAGQTIKINQANVRLSNCTINTHASATGAVTILAGGYGIMESCQFGNATNFVTTGHAAVLMARKCKLGTYTNVIASAPGSLCVTQLEQCQAGTISDTPVTYNGTYTYFGNVVNTTAKYRTGGASDGTNAYAWEMTPSANAEEQISPLITPPMTVWVAGGSSTTFTVYIAGGAEMYDDEVWMELNGPDDTSPNTTTQGYFYSSKCAWRATHSALTADAASTWNGSDVSTKRKISCTYTPQESGPVSIRICYAKTSGGAIAVDPKIEVA